MDPDTKEKIQSLLNEKNQLHHEVVLAVIQGDVETYLDVFSENVPQIIKIEKELFSLRSNTRPSIGVSIPENELSQYQTILETKLMGEGCYTQPKSKDIERVENSILKSNSPKSAAGRMAKITEDKGKLFCRGKCLIEKDREDLAQYFWVKILDEFKIPIPTIWGGAGLSSQRLANLKNKDSFTPEQKCEAFDMLFEIASEIFRRVTENDDCISSYYGIISRRVLNLLGSEAFVIVKNKMESQ